MKVLLSIREPFRGAIPRYAILAGGLAALAFLALLSAGSAAQAGLSTNTAEGRPCESEPTDEFITYGDLITCEINPIGDTDIFRFYGKNGEKVVMQAARQSGGMPCVELFRPDGTRIGSQECNYYGARIDATLDQTGNHAILVNENLNDETMASHVTLQCASGTCAPTPKAQIIGFVQVRGQPLARVPVVLREFEGRTWRAVTDVNGRYTFTRVPSGIFSITIQPQAGLSAQGR